LIIAGLLIGRRTCDGRLLLLGIGALTHIIFDPVSADPHKLFWPLLARAFRMRGGTYSHP